MEWIDELKHNLLLPTIQDNLVVCVGVSDVIIIQTLLTDYFSLGKYGMLRFYQKLIYV